jgi:hypothetical protein
VGAAALVAVAVRVLPWLLDPSVPWQAAEPFARTLASLALEVAILVGWPVGWGLAGQRLVERGEARVLATLGERPSRTLLRLAPQGVLLAALLGAVSFVGGRDAREPGRVVRELVAQSRAACASSPKSDVYAIPFAGAAWLCTPGAAPRLVGRGPGALGGVLYTAEHVETSDDLRRIDLTDANLAFLADGRSIQARAKSLTMRGLPAFAQAAIVSPGARAALMIATGASGAGLTLLFVLVLGSGGRRVGRIAAVVVGAAGPLAALGCMRALERTDAPASAFLLLPVACALGAAMAHVVVGRLPWGRATATN